MPFAAGFLGESNPLSVSLLSLRATLLQHTGMAAARRESNRNFNLANLLVIIGLALLVVVLWMPFASASRSARLELEAEGLAWIAYRAAMQMQPLDLTDPIQREILLARIVQHSHRTGGPLPDPVTVEDARLAELGSGELIFTTKHYAFAVVETPWTALASTRSSLVGFAPIEVYAWPMKQIGPVQTAFYFSETTDAAFTRNLAAGYHGLDPATRPAAGAGRRRAEQDESTWYRGRDDERWIVTLRPTPPFPSTRAADE